MDHRLVNGGATIPGRRSGRRPRRTSGHTSARVAQKRVSEARQSSQSLVAAAKAYRDRCRGTHEAKGGRQAISRPSHRHAAQERATTTDCNIAIVEHCAQY